MNLEKTIRDYEKQKVVSRRVAIGCDPEFIILNGNTLIESKIHNFKTVNYGKLGHDGGGYYKIFEFQPNYSLNPLDVVNNIRGIFLGKVRNNPEFLNYNFKAGSFAHETPLGGHIHFSSPDINLIDSVVNFTHASRILDNYVGAISVLLEDTHSGKKRRDWNTEDMGEHGGIMPKNGKEVKYGCATNWRPQKWGFEYRSCSSWVMSPQISAAFLCLGKVVFHEFLNNPKFTFKEYDYSDDFLTMKKSVILNRFPSIWKDIQSMSLYKHFKPYIDFLYILISKNCNWENSRLGMKEQWGIINCYKNNIIIKNNIPLLKPKQQIPVPIKPIADINKFQLIHKTEIQKAYNMIFEENYVD